MSQGLDRLAALGIPTVVLMGPNSGGRAGVEGLTDVIRVLGEVFERRDQAARLSAYLEESIRLVHERTKSIPEPERRSVLLLGLNPRLRAGRGAGQASGTGDIQSLFAGEIVHARNAYRGRSSSMLNFEQILALDPDVIIPPTANGFHPPRELCEGPYFRNLQHLRAVRAGRVGSLPWSPCNCEKRLEYPIDVFVIACTVYPELFKDFDLAARILGFCQAVYGVGRERAMGLLRAQWLDWTLER